MHTQGEQTFRPQPCVEGGEAGSSSKRPASAPRAAAGKREHSSTIAAGRPSTPGRKVMNGETWGTYNPM